MAEDSSAQLVVLVPTRGRPHALAPLAVRFAETTPPHRLVFIADPDDPDTLEAAFPVGDVLVPRERLSYPAKINHGARHTTEPLLLFGADDIRPHPGWLAAALEPMTVAGVGFVSLNDLGNERVMAGEYATLPLVARWYVEQGGIDGPDVYHEGYRHNGADLEASEVARSRGAFAYAPAAVMEHLHPNYGKAEPDATYLAGGLNREGTEHDDALIAKRRALWA